MRHDEVGEIARKDEIIMRLGGVWIKMIRIKVAEAVLRKDHYWRKEAVLLDRQFNKEILLPIAEDDTKLNGFTNAEISNLDLQTTTPENFKYISQLCGAKSTPYNRRRLGEVENLDLQIIYDSKMGTLEINTQVLPSLI